MDPKLVADYLTATANAVSIQRELRAKSLQNAKDKHLDARPFFCAFFDAHNASQKLFQKKSAPRRLGVRL